MTRARSIGALIDVAHLRYDSNATVASTRRDCIGRRELIVGPLLTTALVVPSDNLWRDLDRLFTYREDAEGAALDVVRLASQCGALVSVNGDCDAQPR